NGVAYATMIQPTALGAEGQLVQVIECKPLAWDVIRVAVVAVITPGIVQSSCDGYVIEASGPVVFELKAQSARHALDQLELHLAEVLEAAGSVVVDGGPGLEWPLRLEGDVGLLDGRQVDVEGVPEQVLHLGPDIGCAGHPILAELLFEGQGPLLLARVSV